MNSDILISRIRLSERLSDMAKVGALPDGGVSRLALTDADKAGRDLLISWMEELSLIVRIDKIGNIIGLQSGREGDAPILIGSHLDTVNAAGSLDGALGVLAGLEILETVQENSVQTHHPIAMVAFTNEEGTRFSTDMMGSRIFCGELSIEDAYDIQDVIGLRVGDELHRIGYAGSYPFGKIKPHAYLELHIEQGPILDREHIRIGAVEAITGISWHEIRIRGLANHAGTTPMDSRRDAGFAAARIIQSLREIATSLPKQRATCGQLSISPGVINVIPGEAVMTVDFRNWDDELQRDAEHRLSECLELIANQESVEITSRILMRVSPSKCDLAMISQIEMTAEQLGYSYRRIDSGAGHDAQIMTHICPTAMIFIPSRDGISHNPAEYSTLEDIEAGANVLLHTILNIDDAEYGSD